MDPVEPPIRTTGNPGPERTVEPQGQGQQYRGRAEQRPERPAPPTQPLDITPRPTSRYLPNPSDRGDAPQVGGSPETQRTGSPRESRADSPAARSSPKGQDSAQGHQRGPSRRVTMVGQSEQFLPIGEKNARQKTVGERLQPTIDAAAIEKAKYSKKATMTGYALNIAIGAQVLLGAMTTAIGATGKQTAVAVSSLGGMSTMVASFLARTQGSHEPELSITRVKDLEHFLRDCHSFQMDKGHLIGTAENGLDYRLDELRRRFEELLGNASGERKLSPV
ncbi:hypothetical protein PAXINDRAFT_172775 [Paxillus involutus ATCC 200175]|uniref:SMODS and SLOG-associating 2TM effector domain-containing protein n=1 Tax=Paxillus involutus ATCC 200175 TaxID=664439 RepID=A0A0C9SP88_PAXIN|nr:hypothetical protein PAXINDRAFT_172775 [Paxillus involutus ATCC 200175]